MWRQRALQTGKMWSGKKSEMPDTAEELIYLKTSRMEHTSWAGGPGIMEKESRKNILKSH